MIKKRKEICDALYYINQKLGITSNRAQYDVEGSCVTNMKKEFVSINGETIMAYIDNKDVNYEFRQWLIENDYVIPTDRQPDDDDKAIAKKKEDNMKKLRQEKPMNVIHVVPRRIDEAKYYVNPMDAIGSDYHRAFNGNFAD